MNHDDDLHRAAARGHGTDDAHAATGERLRAALAARARSEVPDDHPRPFAAPRPAGAARPGGGRAPGRRRLALAGATVLVAAAAVTGVVVLHDEVTAASRPAPAAADSAPATDPATTTPPTPATTTAPTVPPATPPTPPPTSAPTVTSPPPATASAPAPPGPPLARIEALFVAATGATRSRVVAVPGGYEGADLHTGTIRFLRWTGTAWAVVGTSTYPAVVRADAEVAYDATIARAAVVDGMSHAAYVVVGSFSGDSTGNEIAYADGPAGWGAVTAAPDGGLQASGAGIAAGGAIGVSLGGDLQDGLLVTVDCAPTAPDNAHCGLPEYRVSKRWRWDGTEFVPAG